MSTIYLIAAIATIVIGGGLTLCCFAISDWHSSESQHWSHVALMVRLDPALDVVHRPVLLWAQRNRPSKWERIHGWVPPEQRRARALASVPAHVPTTGSENPT